jgi:hypothetical protein
LLIADCWLLFLKFVDCDILASAYLCILNINVISLNFIHIFIISADWLLIQFKFFIHLVYIHLHSLTFSDIHNPSLNAILTSYCRGRYLLSKLQIWSCNHSTGLTFFWNYSSVSVLVSVSVSVFASDFDFDCDFDFITLMFDFAFSNLS